MTGAVARKLRLQDRGVLLPGMFADIVIFDPAIVSGRADYACHRRAPAGIPHVRVGGL